MWLEHEPSFDEVKAALLAEDLSKYSEFVFCGFGEPTEALDVLLEKMTMPPCLHSPEIQ